MVSCELSFVSCDWTVRALYLVPSTILRIDQSSGRTSHSQRMLDPEVRPLSSTDILITPVALGCWPISGMTSLDVNEADSLATIEAALEAGINFLDTAYAYGPSGESERLIARAIAGRRESLVIATKGGIAWDANRNRVIDGRPETLRRQCEESLRRLGTDYVELLYLHAPDPNTPLAESAAALARLQAEGKTRA